MLPMPAALQMQLLQQQMLGGGGMGGMGMGMSSYDGFDDDDMYDMMDPRVLYWMNGYGHGNANGNFTGHLQGFDQAAQYYHMMQQIQMMQMMGHGGHGLRHPRRRHGRQHALRMLHGGMGMGVRGMVGGYAGFGGGVGGGGRALMGSPFGMDPLRENQLALMGSPWGGG